MVASITSSTSVTLPRPFAATRRTLRSSSIRLVLVCSRPAVSASTSWMPRAPARSMASKMTALGSPPSLPRTISAPLRSAHVVSCSAAAARNVSPAAISTVTPASCCNAATLPMVVVLPTPLTPTKSHTLGLSGSPGSKCNERSAPRRREVISACSASSSWPGSMISLAFTRARRPPSSSSVTRTPTSARSNASSRSSHVSVVMPVRPAMPSNAPVNAERAFDMRERNDGRSTASSGSASASSSIATSSSTAADGAGTPTNTSGGGRTGSAGREGACEDTAARRRFQSTTPKPNTSTATMSTR